MKKNIEPPAFVSAIYKDMRDRHLLLPALALLLAILAVPILLKSSDEPVSPPPPVTDTGGSQVVPAVLAEEQVSVRDYRKRLDALRSKNPFKQQFQTAVGGGDDGVATAGADDVPVTDTVTESTGGDVTAATDAGGVTESTTDTTTDDVTETTEEPAPGEEPDEGTEPSEQDVKVVEELFTRRVDVKVGLQGQAKRRDNVKPMSILPDKANPVIAFLGTDEAGERAAFVVASDASFASGSGACVPAPDRCLYISLQKGESAALTTPDGQTYELKLLAIRDVELKAD